jgi:hypothetical protein
MKLAILLAVLLAACASPRLQTWVKPDATEEDLRATIARCHAQAAGRPVAPKRAAPFDGNDPTETGLSNASVSLQDMANFRRLVDECLAAEGWTRR